MNGLKTVRALSGSALLETLLEEVDESKGSDEECGQGCSQDGSCRSDGGGEGSESESTALKRSSSQRDDHANMLNSRLPEGKGKEPEKGRHLRWSRYSEELKNHLASLGAALQTVTELPHPLRRDLRRSMR